MHALLINFLFLEGGRRVLGLMLGPARVPRLLDLTRLRELALSRTVASGTLVLDGAAPYECGETEFQDTLVVHGAAPSVPGRGLN